MDEVTDALTDAVRHLDAAGPGRPSRRSFLVGGLAFLAACGSSAKSDGTAAIVLGADDTANSADSIEVTGQTEAPQAGDDTVAESGPAVVEDTTRLLADPPDSPISFEYLDGGDGALADLIGTPLVVNFFASWCPPCRAELPDFEAAFQKYGDRVQFLGFSVADDIENTRELLDETGVTFPVALDPDQTIQFAMNGIAMPTTILIDRFGRVAAGRAGAIPGPDLEALIEEHLV